MVDFNKIDEIREKESEVRKGLLARVRAIDGAIWAGIVVGVALFAVVLLIALAKG